MTISRRQLLGAGAALSLAATSSAAMAETKPAAPEVGDNGLHIQPWFHESFLELPDDLAEAASTGKHLAVMFEQRGCPYCREMHRVNLTRPAIVDYLKANWLIIQLDMWGSRKVVDFDGQAMEERALARKWNVVFTPTITLFRSDTKPDPATKRLKEAARIPGYFKPFHFVTMFEYVADGKHESMQFQKYLQAKFERLTEAGKKPDIW